MARRLRPGRPDEDKPYVDAGTQGFVGKVQVVLPLETACLQCGMNKTHSRIMELRFGCTGEDVSFYEPKIAAEITTTRIVVAVQVREAAKVACGERDAVMSNTFYCDGFRNVAETLEIAKNPDCPNHVER